ncbi:cAMP-mediated signaling protein sok1, partial [Coemansia erecta]
MTESYTTQDNDYLSTHHAQATAAHAASAGSGAGADDRDSAVRANHTAPPNFLNTSSNASTGNSSDEGDSSSSSSIRAHSGGKADVESITNGKRQDSVSAQSRSGGASSHSISSAISSSQAEITHVSAMSPTHLHSDNMSLKITACQQTISSESRTAASDKTAAIDEEMISRSSSEVSAIAADSESAQQLEFGQSWPRMSCGPVGVAAAMTNPSPLARRSGHADNSLARRESEILLRTDRSVAHVARRGIKRRGSDSSIVLMALNDDDEPRDTSSLSSTSAAASIMRQRGYYASSASSVAGTKRKRAMLTLSEGPASAPATFGRNTGGLAAGQSAATTLHGVQLSSATTSSASDASCPVPVSAMPTATRSRSSISISISISGIDSDNKGPWPLPSAASGGDCTAKPRGTDVARDQMAASATNAPHSPLLLQRVRANSTCGHRRAPAKDALSDGVQTAAAPSACQTQTESQTAACALEQASVSGQAQTQTLTQTQAQSQSRSQAKAQSAHAYPPINRFTLRELKIQNILQNPRLRHEVLFEPKLEFRPNSSGQLAESKQRTAQQYWATVEYGLRTESGPATIAALVIELREILAEMAEDSPKAELSQYAVDLRERLDDARVKQQLARGVFDVSAVVVYLGSVMRVFAPGERHSAAIAKIGSYVARGRIVRGLRLAFDVLESIKIDIANASIEMYREYMRATAVAFERSHFGLSVRRGAIAGLSEAREWWNRALNDARGSGSSLDTIFFEVARDLILDDGASVPVLFRMDEARVVSVRRETERLSIAGTVFLSFGQFLQAIGRMRPAQTQSQTVEFRNAAGKVDYDSLAAECFQLFPESCSVQWTEPLRPAAGPAVAPAAGEIPLSRLVADLMRLAERALGRTTLRSEAALLERTLLRAARYECPLREVVEERVGAALRMHTEVLAVQRNKVRGSDCEAMPQSAVETLQRSKLGFLQPAISALSLRIHAVLAHHWLVYKPFYSTVPVAPVSLATANDTKDSNAT